MPVFDAAEAKMTDLDTRVAVLESAAPAALSALQTQLDALAAAVAALDQRLDAIAAGAVG